MFSIEKQKESNILWIKYEYGVIMNSLEWFHGALLRIDHYTTTLGYKEENISDDELEKLFNTDLLLYCYWISQLDGDFNKEKNQLIVEMLPFAYDFKRARKEIKRGKKGFAQMKDTFFPASLGCIATVNSLRVELLKQHGDEYDIDEEFAYSRAFFRLLNMIADTLICYDGKRHEEIMNIVENRLNVMDDMVYEVHGYHPNEKEYEHYFPAQDDVFGFMPLYRVEEYNKEKETETKTQDNEVHSSDVVDVEEIIDEFELSEGEHGFKELKAAAEAGNADAQAIMGDAYSLDIYNMKDNVEAENWYVKAINNGSVHAKYGLIKLYIDEGIDLDQNDFDLLVEAAHEGEADAQCLLGKIYFTGEIVDKDLDEAEYWLTKAVETDDSYDHKFELATLYISKDYEGKCPSEVVYFFKDLLDHADYSERAYCSLAYCYRHGLGVQRYIGQAVYLLNEAVEKEYPLAKYHLSELYYDGDGVERNDEKAMKLLIESANEGCFEAQQALCQYYLGERDGVNKDYYEAAKWYAKALGTDIREALYLLGINSYFGIDMEKSINTACQLFRLAAEEGNHEAMCFLGLCFSNAEWEGADYFKAMKWYEKAIENGSIDACGLLAEIYEDGLLGEVDEEKAFSYYKLGAERGDKESELKLGILYSQGKGVEKNLNLAKEIYNKLSDNEEFVEENNEEIEELKKSLLDSIQ